MNPLSCQLAAENWIWSISEKFLYHPVRNICMLRLVISAMVSPCAGNLTRTRNASRPPHVRAFGRESNEDNWILPEGRAFVSGLGFKLRHLHVFVYWRFNLPVKGLLRTFSPCWVLIRHVENRLWSILEESKPLFFFFFFTSLEETCWLLAKIIYSFSVKKIVGSIILIPERDSSSIPLVGITYSYFVKKIGKLIILIP